MRCADSAPRLALLTALAATSQVAAPAAAALPDPVRAMIQAAIATGDPAKVAAVVEAAKTVSPADAAEIDGLQEAFQRGQRELAAARQTQEQQTIRQAGLFERWEGRGQIGASQSSGNSQSAGITVQLDLERVGIGWRHKLRAAIDFQEANDITTREQYFVSYEPRVDVSPRLFAYALGQWDKDEFQGIRNRYAVSGGLGYQVLAGPALQLSVKAGPAWRRTEYSTGSGESRLAALAGIDLDWQIAPALKLTQDSELVAEGGGTATAFFDANNTTVHLVTGLEAGILASLTARLSYDIEYDSNAPGDAASTDTLSRLTIVYAF